MPATTLRRYSRMRLNKYISDTGYCSRREADRLIAEGRVTLNGQRPVFGAQVAEGDEVNIDGQGLRTRVQRGTRKHVYIALNKPVGITCTSRRTSRAISSTSSATRSAFFRSAGSTRIPKG